MTKPRRRIRKVCLLPRLRSVWRYAAGVATLAGLGLMTGCAYQREPAVTYIGQANLDYYKDKATAVTVPATPSVAADLVASYKPHTVSDRTRDAVRDVTLVEMIHLTLANSEVIRERGQFLAPQASLLTNPESLSSIYDPAIQETSTGFLNRGVEAALSDFDTLFTTQMIWGRDERIQNSIFVLGGTPGQTLSQDTANFNAGLQKIFATGGQATFSHNVDYEYNNAQGRLFPSVYTGNVQAEFRQPLLAGAGIEYNRIAGPQARNNGVSPTSVNQVSNGVLIARINNDVQIAELERSARNIVREAEDAYWNLALAYRSYHADIVNRDAVLQTWRLVQTKAQGGLPGGGAADEAQARDNYYDARSRTEGSLGDLYRRELEVRRLAGLPANDGTVLRPIDEPVTAKFEPDWHTCLTTAITRRAELRRQKFQIKSLELQLVAARNLTQPNLDFISRYRVNGFGDQLLAYNDNDNAGTQQGLRSYYETLTQGNQTGWDLGFQLTMPVGFRAAHGLIQNLELRLAKNRAALAAQEHEVSLELAAAFQDLDRFYRVAQSNLNRRVAAQERLEAYETRFRTGGIGEAQGTEYLDLLLRAQISVAQAEVAYYQAIISYNQAIADIHLRQGTLLDRDGVELSEGSWNPVAYKQALREAWARSHAVENPLLHVNPGPFVLPTNGLPTAVPQPQGLLPMPDDLPPLPAHADPMPGLVPPAPATVPGPAVPEAKPLAPPPPPPESPVVRRQFDPSLRPVGGERPAGTAARVSLND